MDKYIIVYIIISSGGGGGGGGSSSGVNVGCGDTSTLRSFTPFHPSEQKWHYTHHFIYVIITLDNVLIQSPLSSFIISYIFHSIGKADLKNDLSVCVLCSLSHRIICIMTVSLSHFNIVIRMELRCVKMKGNAECTRQDRCMPYALNSRTMLVVIKSINISM